MLTGEAAFFASVLAAPDDDAPRLVFADFLNGQGDPRGEFITLQCRLAAAPDDEARRKLRIAENKLLAANEAKWTAGFFDVAKSTPFRKVKIVFHRGFLEEATLPLEALDELDALFDAAPLLRSSASTHLASPARRTHHRPSKEGSRRHCCAGCGRSTSAFPRVETPRPSRSPRARTSQACAR